MFKIILKSIASTVIIVVIFAAMAFGGDLLITYSLEVFGRWAPFAMFAGVCVVVVFSMCVSFFRFEAKRDAERQTNAKD